MQKVDRLYKQLHPKKYKLYIKLNTKVVSFDGRCTIIANLPKTNQKTIKLHAKDLSINMVTVNNCKTNFSQHDDILTLFAKEEFTKKSVSIEIEYSAPITKAMHGIYQSHTASGDLMIATQFESHHAREAFPCVDETEAKAEFSITLETPNGTALSNMPYTLQTKTKDNNIITVFDVTPVMSPYLVAFVWGDLQRVSTTTNNGTEVSVWSSKNHDIESLVYPLEIAVKALEFLNGYFGVPYPLPKCDHVAIPDFSSGAMENWGLITYREIALLANPDTISTSQKELIALVIAHELSHQWFGNLVTMQWWDDLWLNESFATLMEYLIVDAIYPDWNIMSSFTDSEALMAFRRDILPGVQAVRTNVNHPDEISSLFDPSIVYAKGSRLLWMAYNYVGNQAFKNGLKQYFVNHAYKNTKGSDLWKALSNSSQKDVGALMQPWVEQAGFPYIEISRDNNNSITISQQQLSTEPHNNIDIWPIPLWPTNHNNLVLDNSKLTLKWQEPVLFNKVGGHYVCHYTSNIDNQSIQKQIEQRTLKVDNRLLILSDSALLAKCHVNSLTETLNLLVHYHDEPKEQVWGIISMIISDLRMLTEGDTKSEENIKKLVWSLTKTHYKKLGLEPSLSDNLNDKKLRGVIVSLAAYTENKLVIKEMLEYYTRFKEADLIPADIRSQILSVAVKNGKDDYFYKLISLYPEAKTSAIQRDIAHALCSTKKVNNTLEILKKLKSDKFVRKQDLDMFIVLLLRNKHSRQSTWAWLCKNWQWISKTFASDKSYDMYPRYAAGAFCTPQGLKNYLYLFEPLKDEPALARNIEIGIKEIENKILWRKLDQNKVSEWLKVQ
ncbi:MAG: aminopeptidase [Patescibacteria group bacterium]|nr:aminopeptidase [Patescibacteria group bacterium]